MYKTFTIKRANDVRPYDCEPKVCCNFVLCSYPKFVHILQSPLCKGISEHPNFNLALRTYAVADVLRMQNRGIVTVDCVLYIKCVR